MTQDIRKLYFMFHPVCWGQGEIHHGGPPPDRDKDLWRACLEWEREVNERQKRFMSAMKPDEALVIFPIGETPPMRDLEEHAERALGRRCIIPRDVWCKNAPTEWGELPDPFERFLDGETLEGKTAYLEGVPPAIRSEIEAEIQAARRTCKDPWNIAVFKVLFHSRMAAERLKEAFKARGLQYDSATVESEAFGEGFEQCAMTWKAMLVPYLGLSKPAWNIFELSVTGAPFLINARLKERIKLGAEIQLFLWEGEDNRCIGLYARAWCRLKDPQFYAHVPLEGLSLEVWDVRSKRWPADDSPLRVTDGRMKAPIYNAIRRDDSDGTFYLTADGASFDEFRRRLLSARIGE